MPCTSTAPLTQRHSATVTHTQAAWVRLRLPKLLRNWPQDGAAAAVGAGAADATAGVEALQLAVHVPRPGRGTELRDVPRTAAAADPGLLASAGAPTPSSTPLQQQQQRLQPPQLLQPVPPPELSAGGGGDHPGVQGVPLRLLPMWAFPGTAPDRCLRRSIAYQAVQGHGAQGRGQGHDQGHLPLRMLLEQRPRDPMSEVCKSGV